VNAAKTKPFGYMPFYPGPGLGGHCIPIDPFYLTWKAREYGVTTRFIELAGEINTSMPRYVISRLLEALSDRGKALKDAKILLLGLAYKKDVEDVRESPAFALWEILEERGAKISYHDPFVATVPRTREHPRYAGEKSIALNAKSLGEFDATLIVTDHTDVNYELIVKNSALVVDTRNACAKVDEKLKTDKVVKA
jgi:UDP-N-acetyl-D-glucosamine dehydrogenase